MSDKKQGSAEDKMTDRYTTTGQSGIYISGEGFSEMDLRKMIFPEMGNECRRYLYPIYDGLGGYYVSPPRGTPINFKWATKSIILGDDDVKGYAVRIIEKTCGSPRSLATFTYEVI